MKFGQSTKCIYNFMIINIFLFLAKYVLLNFNFVSSFLDISVTFFPFFFFQIRICYNLFVIFFLSIPTWPIYLVVAGGGGVGVQWPPLLPVSPVVGNNNINRVGTVPMMTWPDLPLSRFLGQGI